MTETENRNGAGLPLPLAKICVADNFWSERMALVRTAVLPYQWALLNDSVPGAAKSFCMRNFKIAGKMNREQHRQGTAYEAPKYTFRGFEALPEDPENPDDTKFYGFVFQDTDFSKWIEAVAYSLAAHPDAALEKTADDAVDIVCAAQQDTGYLDTYYIINGTDKAFTNLRDNHELYCLGHLIEGAVAYFEATGKDKLLKAACRFADYVYARFNDKTGDVKGYPGHEIAEMALFRLYEATGNAAYRDLAALFLDRRGQTPFYFDSEHPGENHGPDTYHQAHKPVREQTEAVGHAVRAVYLYSGMADDARLTGDTAMRDACRALWQDIAGRKMYVTGGVGSTHHGEAFTFAYDLPDDTAYAETCAAIGLVFFARRMLALEAKSEYADVMERALYNGVLSGMAADGKSFFYVNPLSVDPAACAGDPGKAHVKPVRQKWFGCACCPPNLARMVGSVGQYAYTATENTLFVHLYMGGSAVLSVGGKAVQIHMTSTLPWGNVFTVRFAGTSGAVFTVAVRIPAWCGGDYTLRGGAYADMREQDGYLYLTRDWTDADRLCFTFAMAPQYIAASAKVREDSGKVCIQRGPVVYCMEQADNGPDLHLCRLNASTPPEVRIEEVLPGDPVAVIMAEGVRLPAAAPSEALYAPYRPAEQTPARFRFIPYYLWANRGENEMTVWVRTI